MRIGATQHSHIPRRKRSAKKAPKDDQQYVQQAYEQDVTMTPAGEAPSESHARTLLSPRHTDPLSDDDEADVEAQLDRKSCMPAHD